MEKDKEKWIEEVFGSMKESSRAKPNSELFAKIESRIDEPEAKIIGMHQWRMVAAAAVLLLVMNVFALRQATESFSLNSDESLVENTSNEQLISNYKIYE